MNNKEKDWFKRVDNGTGQMPNRPDEVIDESEEAGGEARDDVREGLNNVEAQIDKLRNVSTNNTPSASL